MKILKEGHKYELANFENKDADGQVIQFIEKEPTDENPAVLKTINDGTTNEEILEMLINRMNHLQSKFPCRENAIATTKLDEALMWMEKRTKDRIKRNVEGKYLA